MTLFFYICLNYCLVRSVWLQALRNLDLFHPKVVWVLPLADSPEETASKLVIHELLLAGPLFSKKGLWTTH